MKRDKVVDLISNFMENRLMVDNGSLLADELLQKVESMLSEELSETWELE